MTDQYTDQELNQMCDKAELDDLKARCLVAYWDNQRFGEFLIDAPERMQAAFDVLAEWCDRLCYSDTARRLSGRVDGYHLDQDSPSS
jgi:hypothetical protein